MISILLAAMFVSPVSAQAASVDARVMDVRGEALLYTAANPDGVAAETDVPLEEGDRLVTGPGASVEIGIDGGSVLTIEENSDFTLKDARPASTTFSLTLGTLLAKIKKLAAGEALQVQSPTAVAAVRGTEFGVEVAAGEETHVGVFDEGSVEVRGQQGEASVLSPNQETRVARGMAAERPYELKRLMARRAFMRRQMRGSMKRMARRWKTLPPEQRRQHRQAAMERMQKAREHRRERLQRQLDRGRRREEKKRR